MFGNVFFSLVCVVLLLSTAPKVRASPPDTAGLRRSILALDSAWTMALRDLQEKKEAGTLGETEQDEYGRFVTYLGSRISEYCNLLRASGDPAATADLPCPAENSRADAVDTPPSPSSAEQVAALDQALAESLGGFDEMLLSEKERLNQRLPRQRESGGTGTAAGSGSGRNGTGGQRRGAGSGQAGQNGGQQGGAGGNDFGQGGEAGGNSANSKTGGQQTTGNGSNQAGSSAGGAGSGTGQGAAGDRDNMPKIESGYDDIVARQLREAAEKETDPELKEKLWEEYRKYKQGAL